MLHAEFPKLLIECPESLLQQFPLRECDREFFQGVSCLKLRLNPSEYTPVQSFQNGEPGYVRSLSLIQYQVRAYVCGIDLKISDERDCLFFIFQRLASLSTTADKRSKADIRVWDFVLPEAEDLTQGWTLRTGAFGIPKAQAGRILLGDRGSIKGGFSIKFEEKRLRLR